ncbi:hypothetical protein RJ639_004780 [Escallonia herrerae]|uniref:MRN complex-interacting protein N-terminal domain-containing protein n=1 Tax=Escallonia herrerae TaxID=1293975 RepID=A0AA88W7J4_9ASTE|nr:hypothetical protein RJ639_004780 [Escallonia herrerae]
MANTTFIAVQCCQCSTMQASISLYTHTHTCVKQRKKSSNKWTCVVCNQKQSVIKVFAQGYMAKDVRKFVQGCNMARQLADQQPSSFDRQIQAPQFKNIESECLSNQKKKRTDWSGYIDYEKEEEVQTDSNANWTKLAFDVLEAQFVTELPTAVFKKPKLRGYSAGSDTEEGGKHFRPVFGKRNAGRQANYTGKGISKRAETKKEGATGWSDCGRPADKFVADEEQTRYQPSTSTGPSKWGDYITHDNEDVADLAAREPEPRPVSVKRTSKWNDYITEDDDLQLETESSLADHMDHCGAFEAELNDQRVEEDIHPDFQ